MKNVQLIKTLCSDCIAEGESLVSTQWANTHMGEFYIVNPTTYVDLEGFNKWWSNCNVLMNLLGELANPWSEILPGSKGNTLVHTMGMIGALKSIKDALSKGYLLKFEDLVFAEAFSNLIDQAEYLLEQGYYLPAGVISRAVLEEKLRNLCEAHSITFAKDRPTIADFNSGLYKANIYDKVEFKNIDYLSSIGNKAAHGETIKREDIVKLLHGVKELLRKLS